MNDKGKIYMYIKINFTFYASLPMKFAGPDSPLILTGKGRFRPPIASGGIIA